MIMCFTLSMLVTFWHVLIAFANSLDPVHDQQIVGPDPNHMTL